MEATGNSARKQWIGPWWLSPAGQWQRRREPVGDKERHYVMRVEYGPQVDPPGGSPHDGPVCERCQGPIRKGAVHTPMPDFVLTNGSTFTNCCFTVGGADPSSGTRGET